jgi:hypothetical protein
MDCPTCGAPLTTTYIENHTGIWFFMLAQTRAARHACPNGHVFDDARLKPLLEYKRQRDENAAAVKKATVG